MRRAFRQLRRDTRGGAAIEAGILFPILILMGFGTLDAALLVQQTHRMESGLGAAGSYLAQSDASATDQQAARNLAVTGDLQALGAPVISGWNPSDVRLSFRSIDNSTGTYRAPSSLRIVEIESSVPFKGLGLISGARGGKLQIKARYEARLLR